MKLLKIVLWVAGALVLLAVAAAAIFAATFDPNRYREDVERLVKERTGRTLQLKGPLEIAYWPSLGARVSGVSLSERAAQRQFFSLESAHASVALLPLLRGEIIVDRVRVAGLKAQIVKDRQGRLNFQDLLQSQPGETSASGNQTKTTNARPVTFDIAGVTVEDAALAYRDLASGQELSIANLNLSTGRIAESAEGKIDLSADLKRANPPLAAKLALKGAYSVKPEAIRLDLHVQMDDSTIQGKLDIGRAAQVAYGFDLNIDRIDLDRYLGSAAPKTSAPGKKPAQVKKQDDTPVDLSVLQGLNAQGRLQIGALQIQGLKLANLKTEVQAAGGKAQVGPHSASLYEGSLAGNLALDANTNRVALKESLTNIAVGPMLLDLAEEDRVVGTGNVTLDVSAAGKTLNAMKSSLNGTARVQLRDGAIKGVDIGAILEKARTALGSQSTQAADGKDKTDFSELSASFVIKSGVARNEDLDIKAPLFRVSGAGQVDLARSTIAYVVKAAVVATTQGQGGKARDQLAGLTVPVRLTGPLDDMKYQVDYRGAAGDLARSRIGEKAKESLERRQDRIEDKVRDRLKGLIGR